MTESILLATPTETTALRLHCASAAIESTRGCLEQAGDSSSLMAGLVVQDH